jgi:hypothetical protein
MNDSFLSPDEHPIGGASERRRLRRPTCDVNPTTTQKLDCYDERDPCANSYDHLWIGKDNYDAVLLTTCRPTIR